MPTGGPLQEEYGGIGERVRAGQSRARAQGVHIGRKPCLVDVEYVTGGGGSQEALQTYTTTLRPKFEQCQKSPVLMRHGSPQLTRVPVGAERGAGS